MMYVEDVLLGGMTSNCNPNTLLLSLGLLSPLPLISSPSHIILDLDPITHTSQTTLKSDLIPPQSREQANIAISTGRASLEKDI